MVMVALLFLVSAAMMTVTAAAGAAVSFPFFAALLN
jgi:hypothetical protein